MVSPLIKHWIQHTTGWAANGVSCHSQQTQLLLQQIIWSHLLLICGNDNVLARKMYAMTCENVDCKKKKKRVATLISLENVHLIWDKKKIINDIIEKGGDLLTIFFQSHCGLAQSEMTCRFLERCHHSHLVVSDVLDAFQ